MISLGSGLNRILGLLATAVLTLFLVYISRLWIWRAPWGKDGLFGQRLFPPGGNIVERWVQGTPFAEMSLIVWGCGAIILLSLLHRLASRIFK